MMKRRFAFVVSVLFLAAANLSATTVRRLGERELAETADVILIGRAASQRSVWLGRTLVTLVQVSASEVLKGRPRTSVTLVLPGGVDLKRKVPVAMTFPGAPRVLLDEEMFLFLNRFDDVSDGFQVSGFSQGKYTIVSDDAGERRVTRDLRGLKLQDGWRAQAGTRQAQRLRDFRDRIRAYLGAPQQRGR